jgi:adenine deaminase
VKSTGCGPHARLLAVARGEEPADLLLRGGHVVNVFTGEVGRADVAVCGSLVAGVDSGYTRAAQVVDVSGMYVAPGFIDGHIHIESSLLAVHEFARLVLGHGTTAVVCDPHEIANVLGTGGVRYLLKASAELPLDVFLLAPSCVPATEMETSGARIGAADVKVLLKLDRIIGLAEMMNYPGAVFGDKEVMAKIAAARALGRVVDGHAPGVVGQLLQAYVAAGVGSDHECVGPHEAADKLRAGMRLMVREGSAARNLSGLLPVISDFNRHRCMFVSDDKHPEELLRSGHVDAILRKAEALGMTPAAAIQMVTINPATYFGLCDRGAVAPGYRADLVVIGDLPRFNARLVFKDGRLVAKDRVVQVKLGPVKDKAVTGTVRIKPLTAKSFAIKAEGELCRAIRLVPDQIITESHRVQPTVEKGWVKADPGRDLLKLAVVERHKRSGRVGLGLVSGFGLKKGALGTSVAHDSHNLIVVGTNDADMLKAVRELAKMGGGYVAVADGKVAAKLALPIAGLMSDAPAEKVVEDLGKLIDKAHVWGSRLHNPFITLSFLALPVIPELKLTDKGLVDVGKFQLVKLFVED